VFPLTAVVLLVLGLSRVEVTVNRETRDIEIQRAAARIEKKIGRGVNSIGIITGENDNIPNLQFLYRLLPNRVDLGVNKKFTNRNELLQYIEKYDYVLLYNTEPVILDLLQHYIENKTSPEKIHLLRVKKNRSTDKPGKNVLLERILL